MHYASYWRIVILKNRHNEASSYWSYSTQTGFLLVEARWNLTQKPVFYMRAIRVIPEHRHTEASSYWSYSTKTGFLLVEARWNLTQKPLFYMRAICEYVISRSLLNCTKNTVHRFCIVLHFTYCPLLYYYNYQTSLNELKHR